MSAINYAQHDEKVIALLTSLYRPKKCSCGKHFARVPEDAILQEDEEMSGWYWNCECKSTLFMPIFQMEKAQ